ncbi:MAG: PAS domain-containing protein [Anaerolineales bacterium]|nr:PAS domain-containing protein [Anaerolineales bacterium]
MIPPAVQDDAHVALEDRERRRSLLNLLLLSMLVVGGLAWIVLFFATPSPELTVDDIRVMIHGVLVIIIAVAATYVIARWISIELAGGLLVCLLVVAGAISDSPEQVTNGRAVVFFALPVLIAGLILPPWASFVAAGLCSVAIYWIGVTAGQRVPAIPSMIVLFFIALVAWLFAHSMNRSNAKLHLAVQELRQREADFRVLFADNPLPMCVARTSDAQLIEVNEAAVRHYGYSRDEFLGLKVPDVLVEIAAPVPSSNQLPRRGLTMENSVIAQNQMM